MSLNPLGGIVNVNLDLIIGLTHAHAVETDMKKRNTNNFESICGRTIHN